MGEHITAGFFRRFFATLLDMQIFLVLVSLPALYLLGVLVGDISQAGLESALIIRNVANLITYIFVAMLFGQIVFMALSIYFITKYGGTLSKLLFGLRIVNQSNTNLDLKTAMYRTLVGYAFSSAFCGLGYFRMLRTKNSNLAWHDELFNTKVVINKSPFIGIAVMCVYTGLTIAIVLSAISIVAPIL